MNLKKIKIRILELSDFTDNYLEWFRDFDVKKYSDNQYRKITRESQLEYIKRLKKNDANYLYGIFYKKVHIGNIVLGPIDKIHLRAEISYMIGDKKFWNLGIGTHAISLMIIYIKKNFKINKLCASCASENLASKKVLLNNNFEIEGIRKKHLFYNGKWYDSIEFGLIL